MTKKRATKTIRLDATILNDEPASIRTDERILAQVAREKTRDPWNHAREFGAEFIERDQGTFFEADAVNACVEAVA